MAKSGGGTILGMLRVLLGLDAEDFKKQAADARKQQKDLADGFRSLTGVSFSAVSAIGAVAGALRFSMDAAFDAERANAATESTLRATGRAAETTAEEIGNLALAESRLSGIEDETVQDGINMLLTFKQIGEDTMPRATRAMEDMAVAMAKGNLANVDLNGTAIQLGKALNDPLVGLTALQRVGVSFTQQQKDAIKEMAAMNDIAGAQDLILSELESEFGGMAEAMGGTNLGKIQKAKNEISNLGEIVGGEFIPIVGEAANALAILLSRFDTFNNLLEEHRSEMLDQDVTYEEFVNEMERAAKAAGFMIDQQGNLYRTTGNGIKIIERSGYVIEEAAWRGLKAAEKAEEGFVGMASSMKLVESEAFNLQNTMNEYKLFLDGPMGKENEKYTQSQENLAAKMQEVVNKHDELIAKPWLTDEEKAEVQDLEAEYDDLQQEYIENQDEHTKATRMILANIALQQMSVDGLSQKEAEVYGLILEKWGLIDEATKTAYMDTLQWTSGIDDANLSAEEIASTITGIPGTKEVTINVTENRYIRESYSQQHHIPGGFAAGVDDFVVPPGYGNDSFPMMVSSGERVTVRPGFKGEDEMAQELRLMRRDLRSLPVAIRDAVLMAGQQ